MSISRDTEALPKNRRIFKRLPCNFKVSYSDITRSSTGEATTRDISGGGIGISSDASLNIGDNLEMWIYPVNSEGSFYTRGQVKWAIKTSGDAWRIGINFDPLHLLTLSQLMKEI